MLSVYVVGKPPPPLSKDEAKGIVPSCFREPSLSLGDKERDKDKDTDRNKDKDIDRDRDRETETEFETETQTEIETEAETETEPIRLDHCNILGTTTHCNTL